MQWLNNPWVIGIGGGILSGVLVTLISRFLFERRDSKEYAQKVGAVNREVLYAIRPSVPEGAIPSLNVIESLIVSTARRYGVERKDVFGPSAIADELIKEVMDSSFISSKVKTEFCHSITALKEAEAAAIAPQVAAESRPTPTSLVQYRARMVTMMSMMLGVVTTLTTLFYTVLKESPDRKFPDRLELLLPMTVALMTVFAVTFFTYLRRVESRRQSRDEEELLDNDSKKQRRG